MPTRKFLVKTVDKEAQEGRADAGYDLEEGQTAGAERIMEVKQGSHYLSMAQLQLLLQN